MPAITLLIDSPSTAAYHVATIAALRDAIDQRDDAASFRIDVVRTDEIAAVGDAVVLGPGTPYRDARRAEKVVTDARERGIPLVAT